jgi:hypothetical protein
MKVRDVLAFCGPNNEGCVYQGRFLGHYWTANRDQFIDFSVDDWRANAVMTASGWHQQIEQAMHGYNLGAIQWTAPPLPDFFWDCKDKLMVSARDNYWLRTPALGQAWYTGFRSDAGTQSMFEAQLEQFAPLLKAEVSQLRQALAQYDLPARLAQVC